MLGLAIVSTFQLKINASTPPVAMFRGRGKGGRGKGGARRLKRNAEGVPLCSGHSEPCVQKTVYKEGSKMS